jgi:peptidoglycan/LPS O-acetylase OafA/YrhL
MKYLWKFVDGIGLWIVHEFGALQQLRLGVMLTLLSLPFYPYMFWSGEPPVIYFLSVVAVTLTGLGLIVGTQILYNQEEEKKDDNDV